MNPLMAAILIFSSSFFFLPQAGAQTKVVRGKVAVDGAAIYASPDFDSEVIDYLNQGMVIPMSVKQYAGPSGLGLFHKVKTPGGKIGFITDTDIVPAPGTKIEPPAGEKKLDRERLSDERRRKKDDDKRDEDEDQGDEQSNRKPIIMTRYLGGTLSGVDYSEKFSGNRLHSFLPFAGVRATGPGILSKGGLPVDINIAFYPRPPTYLGQIPGASGNAAGFLTIGDINLILPFSESRHSLWSYSVGLMWTFSDYKLVVANKEYDSEDFRVGIDLGAGYAYRWGKNVVRGDLKGYIEKEQYFGAMATYQREY